jgi:hypothetical protein
MDIYTPKLKPIEVLVHQSTSTGGAGLVSWLVDTGARAPPLDTHKLEYVRYFIYRRIRVVTATTGGWILVHFATIQKSQELRR